MRCEYCHQNEATIQLHMQFNQNTQKLNLCEKCYQKLGQQLKSPVGAFPFGNMPHFDDFFQGLSASAGLQGQKRIPDLQAGQSGRGGMLDQFGRNLTDLAKSGSIDPVIGRDHEVARVIEILNRRNKNNPVLIGEPGVGKTAIAEGLALQITEGKVPTKLQNKQVYALDVSALVADTGIRGQFEERMNQLIAELQQTQDVILFIDEVHLLVGAGSAQGSMDAGNILKPALARGDIQVIGATTLKEYRTIEKDAALERRFQPVIVDEPTVEQAIDILNGIRPKYEDYHQVKYADEAVRACVTLSHRYIQDRFLPDKAIDLLDEAGSKVNLRSGLLNPSEMKIRLHNVLLKKQRATEAEDYERAAALRDEETKLREQLRKDPENPSAVVSVADIQRIIEEKTGIPVSKLQQEEQAKLKDLAVRLAEKVIGQDDAVEKIAKAVRRSRAGLKSTSRPIGSFLFVGPTGVGKTELARRLAEELFGTKDSMIRLDMSEYMEKHAVSKIIGSPPGYVGYDDAGQLTERVRRNPYSLILLDEIEKAHPDVQHVFLQIMEDGRLTDSQGRTVSFKDCIIIMTSNAGVADRRITVGFGVDEETSREQNHLLSLGNYFKPEFLNRFDAIIPFEPLTDGALAKIVEIMLNEMAQNLNEQGIELQWSEEAVKKLAAIGHHPEFGARPLRRVIQDQVEDKIADLLLDDTNVQALNVSVAEDAIQVEAVR